MQSAMRRDHSRRGIDCSTEDVQSSVPLPTGLCLLTSMFATSVSHACALPAPIVRSTCTACSASATVRTTCSDQAVSLISQPSISRQDILAPISLAPTAHAAPIISGFYVRSTRTSEWRTYKHVRQPDDLLHRPLLCVHQPPPPRATCTAPVDPSRALYGVKPQHMS
jgi:hypothetical protein